MTVQNTKPTQHRGGKKGGGQRGFQSDTPHVLAISGRQHVLKELTLFFTGASEIRTTVLREFEGRGFIDLGDSSCPTAKKSGDGKRMQNLKI